MRHGTKMIVAAAAVTAALAAGSAGAALASTAGARPGGSAKNMSASGKPGGAKSGSAGARQADNAITAVVARELHVSTARVSAALRPLFAAGQADTSSSAFAAAARSLGVGTQQLATALVHGKLSLGPGS